VAEGDSEHVISDIPTTEAFLNSNGIAFKTVRHPVTMTNEEMKKEAKFDGEHAGATLAK
jgi:hypothetical protein